jgi:hypothetical protein
MIESRYSEISIDSWSQFREVVCGAEYESWAFRGHSDSSWKLYSTLSRYFIDFCVHKDAWSQQESRSLRIFKRKAHLLLTRVPSEGDSFQWLALMQHHGAPTRLLDFTWSPYVAAFFALERATAKAAMWALFPPKLGNRMIRTIRASQKIEKDEIGPWTEGNYERYFLPNREPLVIIGEPTQMNQRLVAQMGTFVMPGVLDKPVEEIVPPEAVAKFTLDTSKIRRDGLKALYNMNITPYSLFPGVDGLARSLAYELESHWAFDPITMERRDGFFIE